MSKEQVNAFRRFVSENELENLSGEVAWVLTWAGRSGPARPSPKPIDFGESPRASNPR